MGVSWPPACSKALSSKAPEEEAVDVAGSPEVLGD
jgi:hypothetical protein